MEIAKREKEGRQTDRPTDIERSTHTQTDRERELSYFKKHPSFCRGGQQRMVQLST